jgi:UTP--glucose-1-phosphate uridylyltransferase
VEPTPSLAAKASRYTRSYMPPSSLPAALAALPPAFRAELTRAGFDEPRFLRLAATLLEGDAATRRDARNRITGDVRVPAEPELLRAPERGTPEHARLTAIGERALKNGELAFCVMAGGMATRMGGVVKALVEAIDGRTFLDLRLAENRTASALAGRPVPLWLMVSEATEGPTNDALKKANAPAHVATFLQGVSLRLTPNGDLFRDAKGEPSTYSTGHGDVIDALRRSGLLGAFVGNEGEEGKRPKTVWIANLDNLGATIDLSLLGAFLE